MKTCSGVEVYLRNSSPRHWMELNGQLYAPTDLTLREIALSHRNLSDRRIRVYVCVYVPVQLE
jgi:hypothetical protein